MRAPNHRAHSLYESIAPCKADVAPKSEKAEESLFCYLGRPAGQKITVTELTDLTAVLCAACV